jgi:L-ascorbate metabolism protein UlaG (beta-lactamase superfamily)
VRFGDFCQFYIQVLERNLNVYRIMKVSYYGHSCFGIESNGFHLLFDPFINGNEYIADPQALVEQIPANFIFTSHAHGDHSGDLVSIAKRTGATVIANWEIYTWATEQGLKGHPMNQGGFWNFDFGRVRLVSAVHSSSFPDGRYGGNPVGFIVETGGKTFYYAGDTALTMDMQLIAKRHTLDFAFLPIGGNFTMDVHDAVVAAQFINCKNIIGMHYDTFGYIKIDQQQAIQDFKAAGVQLTLMSIGQTIEL